MGNKSYRYAGNKPNTTAFGAEFQLMVYSDLLNDFTAFYLILHKNGWTFEETDKEVDIECL